jgi:hypothetical protein
MSMPSSFQLRVVSEVMCHGESRWVSQQESDTSVPSERKMRMTLGRSSESVFTQTRLAMLRLSGVPSAVDSVAVRSSWAMAGKATAPPMPQRARRARSAALVVMVIVPRI